MSYFKRISHFKKNKKALAVFRSSTIMQIKYKWSWKIYFKYKSLCNFAFASIIRRMHRSVLFFFLTIQVSLKFLWVWNYLSVSKKKGFFNLIHDSCIYTWYDFGLAAMVFYIFMKFTSGFYSISPTFHVHSFKVFH